MCKVWSTNGEDFIHYEIEDAIDAAEDEDQSVIWEGDAVKQSASQYFNFNQMIENIQERAFEKSGEYAGDFLENEPKLKYLQQIIEEWLDSNIDVNFYVVLNVVEIKISDID